MIKTREFLGLAIATDAFDDGLSRCRDLDLGSFLRYSRPRDVRKIIEKELKAKNLNDFDVRAVAARVTANGRPRKDGSRAVPAATVTEYWLTEEASLYVASRSDTKLGAAILRELISAWILARQNRQAERLLSEIFPHLPGRSKPIFRELIADLLKLRRETRSGNPPWARSLASDVYRWAFPVDGQQRYRRARNENPSGSSTDHSMFSDLATEQARRVITTGCDFAKISGTWDDWKVKMELVFGKKALQMPMLVPMLVQRTGEAT